ncbi:CGNR zinc finger domain-containing protein [Kitasatospora sp. DSM 101779]|uniref:CGNR zinc finger domain-containing protein n=1 Tax=Kitasatospora sp. DSM 101779 TaxID=2853165 RepID=UPI0021DAD187|nr:CGNR zinc finger domain-containing protein [Kitasatospora sp. DSM 101779]MCU7822753.1 CGNR zinc finger domain-containing protein [Kitasatospora sp. DSM 101779]
MDDAATGLVLHPREGAAFRFDPGALCLELLPTGGPGAYARYEVLHRPADLADWIAACRLHTGEVSVDDSELAAARELRDALWRLTEARAAGLAGTAEDYAAVNRAAAVPPPAPRIGPDGRRAAPGPTTASAVLSAVARDAVDLFTGPYADRIRVCGGHDCQLHFVDTSRPGRRRWCSMERCGNRHKVRALRARQAGGGEG